MFEQVEVVWKARRIPERWLLGSLAPSFQSSSRPIGVAQQRERMGPLLTPLVVRLRRGEGRFCLIRTFNVSHKRVVLLISSPNCT